jgi:hypothetical protein
MVDGVPKGAKFASMDSLSNHSMPANGATRMRPGRRTALRQAIQIQERVFAESLKTITKPLEVAQLARAWVFLEDRKRILRGKPLPGSLKPEKPKQKRVSYSLQPEE